MTITEYSQKRQNPKEAGTSLGNVSWISGSMRSDRENSGEEPTAAPEALPTVWVAGYSGVQNRLLADLLDQSRICRCHVIDIDDIQCTTEKGVPKLVLVDVLSANYSEIIQRFSLSEDSAEGTVFGLINVQSDDDVGPFLFWKEVHGIFRADTRPEVLVRGVENMLAGNYWFPRGALDQLLHQTRNALKDMNGAVETLTRRERRVLEALAEGASNEAIADRLCISPHTVKSHLYNLFRKIEVSNRVEAAIWARRYLTYRGP